MFWSKFYELCREKNMSPNGVAKEIGVSSGSITSWKQGKVPHHSTLIKIADYFGVSVDYLLGKTDEKEKAPAVDADDRELNEYLEFLRTDPNYRMMFSLMKGATKEDVEKAVKVIKSLLGED